MPPVTVEGESELPTVRDTTAERKTVTVYRVTANSLLSKGNGRITFTAAAFFLSAVKELNQIVFYRLCRFLTVRAKSVDFI